MLTANRQASQLSSTFIISLSCLQNHCWSHIADFSVPSVVWPNTGPRCVYYGRCSAAASRSYSVSSAVLRTIPTLGIREYGKYLRQFIVWTANKQQIRKRLRRKGNNFFYPSPIHPKGEQEEKEQHDSSLARTWNVIFLSFQRSLETIYIFPIKPS